MTLPSTDLLRVFLRERPRLLRLIGRIVRNPVVAEDLAQDTLLRLWEQPFGTGDRSLLLRTGQNLAIDHLRAQSVRSAYAASVVVEQVARSEPAPDRIAADRQALAGFNEALSALPQRTRQILLLNRLDGLTYAQIAARLGMSVSTVEKEMIRALRACRAWRQSRPED